MAASQGVEFSPFLGAPHAALIQKISSVIWRLQAQGFLQHTIYGLV